MEKERGYGVRKEGRREREDKTGRKREARQGNRERGLFFGISLKMNW